MLNKAWLSENKHRTKYACHTEEKGQFHKKNISSKGKYKFNKSAADLSFLVTLKIFV